jgi:hypothetical protein
MSLLTGKVHEPHMPWFNVDDSFYDHPKVWDAPDCAVALWTRAGSWSARSRNDGFVPSGMPARFCGDPEQAVRFLLDRGLWERSRGGYQFHDWTDWNQSREVIEAKRAAAAERQRRHRAAQESNGVSHAHVTRDKRVSHSAQSNPIQEMVDVSDPVTVSDTRGYGDDVIETIIKTLYERTDHAITPDWAAKVADHILEGRHVRDPAGYCRTAILNDPNPSVRFGEFYPETP